LLLFLFLLLSSEAFGLGSILVDLALLFRLLLFLPLHLVSDESACARAEDGSDCGANAWSAYGAADDASCSGSADGPDGRAFFASR
jgi:hypothetical protein